MSSLYINLLWLGRCPRKVWQIHFVEVLFVWYWNSWANIDVLVSFTNISFCCYFKIYVFCRYRFLDKKYVGTTAKIITKKLLIDQFFFTPQLLTVFFVSEYFISQMRVKFSTFIEVLGNNNIMVRFQYLPPCLALAFDFTSEFSNSSHF